MESFTAYTDGACRVSNPGLCSCAFVVYRDCKEVHRSGRMLPGPHTNNVAEYTGLLDLLVWAAEKDIRGIEIFSDSNLVVNQVNLVWNTSTHQMAQRRSAAHVLLMRGGHTLSHVRGHSGLLGNEVADEICNAVLDAEQARLKETAKSAVA